MKTLKQLLIICFIITLSSCSIQKRVHMKGYFVENNIQKHKVDRSNNFEKDKNISEFNETKVPKLKTIDNNEDLSENKISKNSLNKSEIKEGEIIPGYNHSLTNTVISSNGENLKTSFNHVNKETYQSGFQNI